jgi:hypothetical protein
MTHHRRGSTLSLILSCLLFAGCAGMLPSKSTGSSESFLTGTDAIPARVAIRTEMLATHDVYRGCLMN